MRNYLKHILNVIVLFLLVALVEIGSFKEHWETQNNPRQEPETIYKYYIIQTLLIIQHLVLLAVPQNICNFLGLTLFNTFPGEVKLKKQDDSPLSSTKTPHLCLRVVTRGLYPELVQQNVNKNYLTCIETGLSNFTIEVVTDKDIALSNTDERIRQLVVPDSYKTSTGAMFKARALQYALEPNISLLKEGDYIVHLDEETLVTRSSLIGILNFALDGQHAFGQGLITYTNQGVVNWITTLADSYRVADDMGKLRFQFCAFHRPIFGWKGSFVVTKYEAELDVSFDHGPGGSIAEDCYFSMVAFRKNYSFDFIQGEMWEKSPFTMLDLIRQRKRWVHGIWLVVHSPNIRLKNKFFLALSHYAWLFLPLTTLSYIGPLIVKVPTPLYISTMGSFCFTVTLYMYIFGVIKSFDHRQTSILMLLVHIICQVFTIFLNVITENVAVIWGLFTPKHEFYIVEKDVRAKVMLDV